MNSSWFNCLPEFPFGPQYPIELDPQRIVTNSTVDSFACIFPVIMDAMRSCFHSPAMHLIQSLKMWCGASTTCHLELGTALLWKLSRLGESVRFRFAPLLLMRVHDSSAVRRQRQSSRPKKVVEIDGHLTSSKRNSKHLHLGELWAAHLNTPIYAGH